MFEKTFFTPHDSWNTGREEFVEIAWRTADGGDASPSIVFHTSDDFTGQHPEFHHVLSLSEARFIRNKLDAYLEQVVGAQRDLWIQEVVDQVNADIDWLLDSYRDAEINWQNNEATLHIGFDDQTIGLQVNDITGSWSLMEWTYDEVHAEASQLVRYALNLK